MTVVPAPPETYGWLAERTHCALTDDFRAIAAIDASGRIRGMIGYCDWTQTAVRSHMAVDAPIAWRSLRDPTFAYPFLQANRLLLYGTIPANNSKSLATAKALGLRETYRMRDGDRLGVDMVVLELRRDEWLVQRDRYHRKAA